MTKTIHVLLADDHATVREALKSLVDSQVDMSVVGEASDGNMVLQLAKTLRPDIVVMDISMPGMNGLAACRALKRAQPDVAIVVLTRHADEAYMQEFLRAGVSGYVLKQSPSAEFLQAIRVAVTGRQYLDSTVTGRVTAGFVTGHPKGSSRDPATPSGRELDVLRLTALGYSNKEIAARFELSVKTVEVHKANAMRKLDLKGRVHVVRYGVMQGWLDDA